MNENNQINDLFPRLEDIPEKLNIPVHQRQILLNGELAEWNGPTTCDLLVW